MSSNKEEVKGGGSSRLERNPDTTLFVGGIDEDMPEEEFLKAFEPFGHIVDHTILSGKKFFFFFFFFFSNSQKVWIYTIRKSIRS